MQMVDFHIHSDCSIDAHDPMTDMARSAGEHGIDIVCFTDHCDMDDYRTGVFDPEHFAHWPRIVEEYGRTVTGNPSLDIRLGIELGGASHHPVHAAAAAETPGIDFIIGSLHNLRDTPDFYCLTYESLEQCKDILDRYIEEHLELAELDCYDVIGHIGYAMRYMLRDGFDAKVTVKEHGDVLERIFKILAQKGKGIEINCSGFRSPGIDTTIPSLEIIKLYKNCGGEIITLGSDAHTVEYAGMNIEKGIGVAIEAGFEYITLYKDRKPEFAKIL